MLRYAFRRILWAVPTLMGLSVLAFVLTSLIPAGSLGVDPSLEVARSRQMFLDLPYFLNEAPVGAGELSQRLLQQVALGVDPQAQAELGRIGGAALPSILPRLDQLPSDARERIAASLTPVAMRMGLETSLPTGREARALATFWLRFWDDHTLDFTTSSAARAVARYAQHGGDDRLRALRLIDTFALPAVFAELRKSDQPEQQMRLIHVASLATSLGPTVTPEDTPFTIARARDRWLEWWYVYRRDFTAFEGSERALAAITETRYGRWTARVVTGELGVSSRDGETIVRKLGRRVPVTLLSIMLALFGSYAVAVPIGLVTARRRGKAVDYSAAVVTFVLYSIPAFIQCELLRRAALASGMVDSLALLPAVALLTASVAPFIRYQRATVLDVLGQDYVRTAFAKGSTAARVMWVHVLRNALVPILALGGTQLPALLGTTFVVEEVFSVPGLGYETLRAVEARDVPWLVAIVTVSALISVVGILASDVLVAILHPHLRAQFGTRVGRPA
jgi:ABC-type dipeptide/oligopeptide/nickel transport system permease component